MIKDTIRLAVFVVPNHAPKASRWLLIDNGEARDLLISNGQVNAVFGDFAAVTYSRPYDDFKVPNTKLSILNLQTLESKVVRRTGIGSLFAAIDDTNSIIFDTNYDDECTLYKLELDSLEENVLKVDRVACIPTHVSAKSFFYARYDAATGQYSVCKYEIVNSTNSLVDTLPVFDYMIGFAISRSGQCYMSGARQEDCNETKEYNQLWNGTSSINLPVTAIHGVRPVFSSDGTYLSVATLDDGEQPMVEIFDSSSGSRITSCSLGNSVDWLCFSVPDATWVGQDCFVVERRGDVSYIRIWSAETNQWTQFFEFDGLVGSLAGTRITR